jgi:orotidine-5'-phosphate decarboxylase
VAVAAHCCALIDAAGPACVAAKPQLACFERLGAPGWAALAEVVEHARGAGLVVLADAFTASPYLGVDTLEVLLEAARAARGGMFVLVRTSNPGAADLEDLELTGGAPLWARVAAIVDELGAGGVGASALSDVGAVVGATAPEHVARMRELMPHTIFLLPGIGAQGGRVEDLAPAFAPHRAAGLVTASRSIASAHEQHGGAPAAAARAEAERLRAAAWALA